MRIIHDIEGPMQAMAFVQPLMGKDKKHSSARVELVACSDPNYVLPLDANEAIHIEGDAAAIIKMLDQWKHLIEMNAEMLVKEGQLEPEWRDFDAHWSAKRSQSDSLQPSSFKKVKAE
jgi:hypothetical protein